MSLDDSIKAIHAAHQAGQQKYTYFLLAAAGAAIAFAVQKTESEVMPWWLLPVGASVVAWGGSFFCGCKNVVWVQSTLYANMSLLQLRGGTHADQPSHPAELEAAIRGVSSALAGNGDKAQSYGQWQFRLFVLGALFFIAWRVIEMARIT